MNILNLGCGTRTSPSTDVMNIDFSIRLSIKNNPLLYSLAKRVVSKERMDRIDTLPENILVHNLKKGIPFDDNSVDVVYHSHLIEHIDRSQVEEFINENRRVLKPGGILRIAFPDMEALCTDYLEHFELCDDDAEAERHEDYIDAIIGQIARVESFTTSQQTFFRRKIENIIVGDARRKGEAHMWMYDRVNLAQLLEGCGFSEVTVYQHNDSSIPNWSKYQLDTNADNTEYKQHSSYVEARK